MKRLLYPLIVLLLVATTVQAQKPHIDREFIHWADSTPSPQGEIAYTVWLIGDAGEAERDPLEPNFKFLKSQLDGAEENSAVVFLGDNIYPAGLPTFEDPEKRAEAERRLDAQLDLLSDFDGNPFFVPGNHDWNKYSARGREAVRRQEQYIHEKLNREDVFLPNDGCSGPIVVELEDNLVLVVIDTEWWLHDWDKEPDMNQGCPNHTRPEFVKELEYVISEYDDKNILVAAHHPIFTNGPHGGFFTVEDHLFPLRDINKALWIPLPVIGSIYPVYRKVFGHRQDNTNPLYERFRQHYFDATYRKKNIVYAAGHEHSLQYFNHLDNHYIVSGSGCKTSPVRSQQDAEFAQSSEGFSKLIYMADGSVYAEFWNPDGDGSTGHVSYRRQLRDKVLQPGAQGNPPGSMPDSVSTAAHEIYNASNLQEVLWGEHYRGAWTAEVKAPTLNLSTTMGGLTPIKLGGGQQSKSMRLETPDKRQFVLRSIAKDASLLVPENIENTVYADLLQDQISMAHPYGAFVVPPMAAAVGVYHTNPQLVYVPKQVALGDYNRSFGDQFYLFEERPRGDLSDVESFGNSKKIISYGSLIRKTQSGHDHRVEQKQVLRSRLFDIWLGDWDRHDDQWRWASFEKKGYTEYEPIPRDRDQVFLRMDGLLPSLLTGKAGLRQFQTFDFDIRDIKGLCFNAKHFDRAFLTEQDQKDWVKMAEKLRVLMTDSMIEAGIGSWPDTIFALNGPDIINKLKARRDRLPEFAREYYAFLAREVDVVGTDERERFIATRINDLETRVEVWALNHDGKKKDKLFERVFNRKETAEVRLYGLYGDDEFKITGEARDGVLIRVIGGEGEDVIEDDSRINGMRNMTKIYDNEAGTIFRLGSEAAKHTSPKPEVHEYDRKAFKFDHALPVVYLAYNLDDGFFAAGGARITKQGFRSAPYKYKQSFRLQYAVATGAYGGRYTGDFINVLKPFDLYLDFEAYAPTYVQNFFGLGNETVYDTDDLDFNRLRMSQIKFSPSLKKTFNSQVHEFRIGPRYTQTTVEQTDGRFIVDDLLEIDEDEFEDLHYLGVGIEYKLFKSDSRILPTNGLNFELEAEWKANFEDVESNFTHLRGELSTYFSCKNPFKATLAMRLGGATNIGDYSFFQANALGRNANLRGHRADRFAGDDAAWFNSDLRLSLFRFRNRVMPGTVGLLGSYDIGRVWYENENSNVWHPAMGGGIWFSPLDFAAISLAYMTSDDDDLIEFRFGFFF